MSGCVNARGSRLKRLCLIPSFAFRQSGDARSSTFHFSQMAYAFMRMRLTKLTSKD